MSIIYAILYGLTMKIADLLNEHGLKWFKGAPMIFGLLWGIFGCLLVTVDPILANIILAMNVAFILRNRLDYPNHQLASSMIIIVFLFTAKFLPIVFIVFYLTFLIFGSLKDYVDDVLKKHRGFIVLLNELMWYYPAATFIYCLGYGQWLIFWTLLAYTIAYNAVKYIAKKHYHLI